MLAFQASNEFTGVPTLCSNIKNYKCCRDACIHVTKYSIIEVSCVMEVLTGYLVNSPVRSP